MKGNYAVINLMTAHRAILLGFRVTLKLSTPYSYLRCMSRVLCNA